MYTRNRISLDVFWKDVIFFPPQCVLIWFQSSCYMHTFSHYHYYTYRFFYVCGKMNIGQLIFFLYHVSKVIIEIIGKHICNHYLYVSKHFPEYASFSHISCFSYSKRKTSTLIQIGRCSIYVSSHNECSFLEHPSTNLLIFY